MTSTVSTFTLTRRSVLAGSLAAVAGLGLAACSGGNAGSGSASAKDGGYKIGVLQLTEHAALDAANKGFISAMDEAGVEYSADQQNAQNDQSACQTIANKFVSGGYDLIFAIATPAAQAAAGATSDIPIVAAAITDFAESDLVRDNDKPGTNVTGCSDMTPVAQQLDLMVEALPSVKKVGILFCTAEANSVIQVELAEEKLDELGIEHKRYSVSSSNEIQSVCETMVGEVDAIYTPTDNTIASGMAQVAQIALDAKVPTVCGEKAHVDAGGLFSLSIDYEKSGYKAGQMAVKILKGEGKPEDMAIEHLSSDELELVVNDETAAALGLGLSGLTA